MEFYFQSNSVMNSLKCPKSKSLSHCLTELFPFYQNKHWTIQRRNDGSVDQPFHRILWKIVGFQLRYVHRSQKAVICHLFMVNRFFRKVVLATYRNWTQIQMPCTVKCIFTCVSTGAAGAGTHRTLRHCLLHPLILRLLVLLKPADFEAPQLSSIEQTLPTDPNS